MLPEGWRVPSMTFLQFITIWLTGDQENGVPPLRNVTVYHWRNHATQYCRIRSDMQYLMGHVERIARNKGVWKENPHQWTTNETLVVYKEIQAKFKYQSSQGRARNRFSEFSWQTIVNLVRNHKGKLVGEPQSDSKNEEGGGVQQAQEEEGVEQEQAQEGEFEQV